MDFHEILVNFNEYNIKFIAIHWDTLEFIGHRYDPEFTLFLEDSNYVSLWIRK